MPSDPQSWAIVVPVKRLSIAKTRLALDPALRVELALAMAADTVTACVSAGAAVLVVTDDERAGAAMRDCGADVERDRPDAGLNAALRHGAHVLAQRHPTSALAAVSSDLPALTADAIAAVLEQAGAVARGCVADAAGTGTTVLTAKTVHEFVPQFGAGSWQRHRDAGAVDLSAVGNPLARRDVDTLADLAEACALGCGAATHAVLTAHPTLLV